MDPVVGFLLLISVMTPVFLLLAIGAWIIDWRQSRKPPLPEPDDPRLRNVNGILIWRAKKAQAKRRWAK